MARPTNIALVAALAASLVALPATAVAKGGGNDVRSIGSCTKQSSVKMKLSPENGRTEIEFEVDQNRVGVTWNWSLSRADAPLGKGAAVTLAPSGSFEVRRVVSRGGTFVATASRSGNPGETCRVIATI